ncbi:MAG: hypothetical protein Q8R44_08010 [Novosphingobium sp.]|nr:hypothetical protein [Novosphingobium sp.]
MNRALILAARQPNSTAIDCAESNNPEPSRPINERIFGNADRCRFGYIAGESNEGKVAKLLQATACGSVRARRADCNAVGTNRIITRTDALPLIPTNEYIRRPEVSAGAMGRRQNYVGTDQGSGAKRRTSCIEACGIDQADYGIKVVPFDLFAIDDVGLWTWVGIILARCQRQDQGSREP